LSSWRAVLLARLDSRSARFSFSVGPLKITMPLPTGMAKPRARLLVAGTTPAVAVAAGRASLEIPSILDHEVVLLS
jgi:hypothetical protein